jgi:hypothetical protein
MRPCPSRGRSRHVLRGQRGGTRGRWAAIAVCAVVALLGAWAPVANAQRGIAREAALYMVLPLGARAVASGQSVASPDADNEQLHWNPAAIARATDREVAFNFGRFYVGPLTGVNLILPFERAGVVGVSVSVLDYGSQETGDGVTQTGTASQHAYVLSATYATALNSRATLGFTFKSSHFVGSCSGLCPPLAQFHVSTSAVDIGSQMKLDGDGDWVVGATIRNAGLRLQVNDEAQADPLPTRIQVGVSYRVRAFEREIPAAQLRVMADLIDRIRSPRSHAPRFGLELGWKAQARVRAGYVVGSGEGTGFGAGFGFVAGRAAFDVGQTLGGEGDASKHSTYLSLRYRW